MDVLLPNIGDFKNVPIIEILVSPGDTIEEGDTLLVLESDKATLDIPSPQGGTITNIMVQVGQQINCGDLLLTLDSATTSVTTTPQQSAAPSITTPTPADSPITNTTTTITTTTRGQAPYASPTARKLARENEVNLSEVTPTGKLNRIRPQDVLDFVQQGQSNHTTSSARSGTTTAMSSNDSERIPLSRMQNAAIRALEKSWATIPHVTHCHEVDITALENFRKELNAESQQKNRNTKLTLLPFLIAAVARVLRAFPRFNAVLDGDHIIQLRECHIGVVVDTEQGVTIPVVFHADRLGVWNIAADVQTLAQKAREGQLKLQQLQGATFTISSFGGLGAGHFFTPIISSPQVAILGVGRSMTKPVLIHGELQERTYLPFSLSYDHRVINGANTAAFFSLLEEILLDIRRAIL